MISFGDVISESWPSIEPFLDVESLISASESSRSLRDLAADPATGKLKASVVKVDCFQRAHEAYNDGLNNWKSAPIRIPNYVPRLLNALHFPALRRLHMGFPRNRTEWNGAEGLVDGAHSSTLPILADKVGAASNLEELVLHVNSLLPYEEGGGLRGSLDMLGENLAGALLARNNKSTPPSCGLRKLQIFNEELLGDGLHSKFSSDFLAAMVPVLRAGVGSLEHVLALCGDMPSSNDRLDSCKNFFSAILHLRRLKKLQLQLKSIHSPLLNDLIDASTTLTSFPSDCIEELSVMAFRPRSQEPQNPIHFSHSKSIYPFLSLLYSVTTLETFSLLVPPECWDEESIAELNHLFNGSPSLTSVVIDFYGYEDASGLLLDYLASFLERKESTSGLWINLMHMGGLDEESNSFVALRRYKFYGRDGGHCLCKDGLGTWQFRMCD
eukprot:CAMPEP_0181086562 /NCGR_PEP_ID=MMETSP1071-20121207/5813_1 /TAXON_ID=35127 /ORGANISM="Thalassiosira sp., Strain NH16" /LENGTH=439 /DNA_ID=CAMNT_0023168407 /DNA_START=16 /DNA_END=1335 /DNA_ORIENTATION=-